MFYPNLKTLPMSAVSDQIHHLTRKGQPSPDWFYLKFNYFFLFIKRAFFFVKQLVVCSSLKYCTVVVWSNSKTPNQGKTNSKMFIQVSAITTNQIKMRKKACGWKYQLFVGGQKMAGKRRRHLSARRNVPFILMPNIESYIFRDHIYWSGSFKRVSWRLK